MSMDQSYPKHLEHLAKLGKELLTKTISPMSTDTGRYEDAHCPPMANAEALKEYAY